MKIAVFHGFLDLHFEMFGYLIDYFYSSKIPVDFFSESTDVGLQWKKHYDDIFKINLTWYPRAALNPDDYELILLVTDDDPYFPQKYINMYGASKIVCIDHHNIIRRAHMLSRITTRFFYNRPRCPWAIPCYQIIDKFNKKKLISTSINIACIGEQNLYLTGEYLQQLFTNFSDITFHIISRKIQVNYDKFSNIHIYQNCPTDQLMQIVQSCSHIFCTTNPHNPKSVSTSLSASIPLAFGAGCQLIIPKSWQYFYQFKSVLTHDDSSKITLSPDIPLDIIYSELYEHVSHRNKVFDDIIKLKYSNQPILTTDLLSNVCKVIGFSKPNIAVSIGIDEIFETIKDSFREIHLINRLTNSNSDLNPNPLIDQITNPNLLIDQITSRYIQIHTDSIEYNMNEPIIFYLIEPLSLLKELNKIGKRTQLDILLIKLSTDINCNDIIHAYGRKSFIYNTLNSDVKIMIPQK